MSEVQISFFDPKYFRIEYVAIPWVLNNPKTNMELFTLKKFVENNNADGGFNLAAFNMSSAETKRLNSVGNTIQHLVAGGKTLGYGKSMSTDVVVSPSKGNEVSGYKLRTSAVPVINNIVQKGLNASKTARNFHGVTKSGKYVVVQSNASKEEGIAQSAIKRANALGEVIEKMVSLDGGGSVGSYCTRTKMGYYPQGADRKIASAMLWWYIGPVPDRILKRGCKGTDVAVLQIFLCIDADGSFGPATEKALRNAQYKLGIPITGMLDEKTRISIFDK